ncbi:anthrone oxygenase family protein [Bdellovibrio sp. HCB209]|uniref:anthrone oxygenase family protein n=1 Tax=Bdellovibrio sp. HCB209 TaxID=3394354 RepID=UPI0039B49798
MKLNQFLKYTSLLLIGLLAGNAFAFMIGMGPAMQKLSASSYIAFHQSMQRSFLSWTPLLCMVVVFKLVVHLIVMRRHWKKVEFLMVSLALLCIVDELVMTWTGNMPLNKLIYSWQFEGAPNDWQGIRNQWVSLMYWRCTMLIMGFSFLIGSVLVRKTESPILQDAAVAF